jgi:hypothetical protein
LPEAEARAAEVYRLAREGADFDDLILRHSYEGLQTGRRPGTALYILEGDAAARGPSVMARGDLPKAVGDAAWRLEPGEIGVVERHQRDANEGYYILRRLTDAELERDDPAAFDTQDPAVQAMRESARELLARPEHEAERVTVQHILIARFSRGNAVTRDFLNEAEAETAAARVFAAALEADDFAALVEAETYDSLDGVYRLVHEDAEPQLGEHRRGNMVKHFWQAAWRLQPGETGVILYHRAHSPYGYHIMRRID